MTRFPALSPRWRSRSLWFSGLLCAFALAMGSLSVSSLRLAETQANRLAYPTLKNNLWVTTQLQLEALRFRQSMDDYLLGRTPIDTPRLRLELLASRFEVLQEYGTREHMGADTWQQMMVLEGRVDDWSRRLAQLPADPEAAHRRVQAIEDELNSHLDAIHRMTLEVHLDMTEAVDKDRLGTKDNFTTLARTLSGLALSVLTLLVFLLLLLARTRKLSLHLAGLNNTLEAQVVKRTHALHDSEERLRLILAASPIGVALLRDRDGHRLFVNRLLAEQLGPTAYNDAQPLAELLAEPRRYAGLHRRYRRERELRDCEVMLRGRDGDFPALLTVQALTIDDEPASLIWVYDNSRRQQLEDELRLLATTDPLTELPNRRAFLALAEPLLTRARQQNRPLSLIMLDIDHFKQINDSYGHPAGDQALRRLAAVLRDSLRGSDVCGRLGGEEFVVLLPDTPIAAAMQIAERLRCRTETIDVPLSSGRVLLTISLGVAALHPDDPDLATLFARTDQALYEAKHRGRNRAVSLD